MISCSHWGMFDDGGPKWIPIGLNQIYIFETGEILTYDAKYLHG